MVRKKDPTWDMFISVPHGPEYKGPRVQCQLCKKIVSRQIGVLKNHVLKCKSNSSLVAHVPLAKAHNTNDSISVKDEKISTKSSEPRVKIPKSKKLKKDDGLKSSKSSSVKEKKEEQYKVNKTLKIKKPKLSGTMKKIKVISKTKTVKTKKLKKEDKLSNKNSTKKHCEDVPEEMGCEEQSEESELENMSYITDLTAKTINARTGPKWKTPITCPLCPAVISKATNLKQHMITHHLNEQVKGVMRHCPMQTWRKEQQNNCNITCKGSSGATAAVSATSSWRCELVPHKDQVSSSVKWDVNYYSPENEQLSSKKEAQKFLDQYGLKLDVNVCPSDDKEVGLKKIVISLSSNSKNWKKKAAFKNNEKSSENEISHYISDDLIRCSKCGREWIQENHLKKHIHDFISQFQFQLSNEKKYKCYDCRHISPISKAVGILCNPMCASANVDNIPLNKTADILAESLAIAEAVEQDTPSESLDRTPSQKRKIQDTEINSTSESRLKKVSFGPLLNPEQFDKMMPPATPVSKGEKPDSAEKRRSSSRIEKKQTSFDSPPSGPSKGLLKMRSPTPVKPYLARRLGILSPWQDSVHVISTPVSFEAAPPADIPPSALNPHATSTRVPDPSNAQTSSKKLFTDDHSMSDSDECTVDNCTISVLEGPSTATTELANTAETDNAVPETPCENTTQMSTRFLAAQEKYSSDCSTDDSEAESTCSETPIDETVLNYDLSCEQLTVVSSTTVTTVEPDVQESNTYEPITNRLPPTTRKVNKRKERKNSTSKKPSVKLKKKKRVLHVEKSLQKRVLHVEKSLRSKVSIEDFKYPTKRQPLKRKSKKGTYQR